MLAAIHTHPSTPHKSDHIDQALHKTKTDLAAVAIMSPAFNGIKITWPITQKEDPFLCNKSATNEQLKVRKILQTGK